MTKVKSIGKEQLWSMSTSVREAERTLGFLQTVKEIEGMEWNVYTQKRYQALLVKNRVYLDYTNNTQIFNKLNIKQKELLQNKSSNMTYLEAEDIINAKNYVGGAEMRGRQSINPLRKLGLVSTSSGKIIITNIGYKLLNAEIDMSEFMLDSFLKYQLPNPNSTEYSKWNVKPFISTLRLIKIVNKYCREEGKKEKGISKIEFGIFALSLRRYDEVDNTAKLLLKFRYALEELPQNEKNNFIDNFIDSYLSDFKNPTQNVKDYTDNVIRYMRITKYIYIHGKYEYAYIDIEPRRATEIDAILDYDNGAAKEYSMGEWEEYIGIFGSYALPFETVSMLTNIAKSILDEVHHLATLFKQKQVLISIPNTIIELKKLIYDLRMRRTELQNLKLKQEYYNSSIKITEVKETLRDILRRDKKKFDRKLSIELEKWVNIALNVLNDARSIKPNTVVGDDNEPIFTAPSGVPDIECYYSNFNVICEVTMLISRDQWFNEGQPVMRHLRDFEMKNNDVYCLFVAPSLHADTINTFWISTKYEYQGKKQKIIPMTIGQLIDLIDTAEKVQKQGKKFTSTMLEQFYKSVTEVTNIESSIEWIEYIKNNLYTWRQICMA